ncbi:hypothetical protein B0H11DRAFT_1704757 [Mycena galericulata]|nr:hypothetical protein B0H11DRAFT_1704757 [Mycena galericulata]
MHAPLKKTDEFVVSSLVGQGLFPCSPFSPKLAIATRVLEVFRVARLRSPTLSIQGWVKSLCDLHGQAYIPYLSQQFTICFDLYLETLKTVDQKVAKVLGRDAADWQLKNCCPSCTYKLEGEQKLIFYGDGTFDDAGNAGRGKSERQDPRTEEAGGDYFVSREKVDLWSKELLAELVNVPVSTSDDPEEKTACEERWKNLSDDLTARMWGVFDETGVFLALCRHGFVLLLVDMVRSGELAKYPLAIVDALLDAFGPDVGDGYDVGCGLESTIKKTPLKEKAERLNFKSLVGAFHGHAHNRLCQLTFLATYVPGLGLEDLEGCERFFSQSIVTTIRQLSEILDEKCAKNTKSTKVAQRHAHEGYGRALAEVEESENKMEILVRWTQDNKEWDEAAELLNTRRYRLCINELEALVLKRMFELTKMNMSPICLYGHQCKLASLKL